MSEPNEKSLHGIRVTIPPDWVDGSIYRFAVPAQAATDIVAEELTSNLIATQHEVPKSVGLEQIFEAPNAAALKRGKEFTVQRSGAVTYLRQSAFWQDVRFFEPGLQRPVFQRQLAFRTGDTSVVILTLTASTERLRESVSRRMGFAAPPTAER